MKKVNRASLSEVVTSNEEQKIVGTDSLGPCVGLLIYNRSKKVALASHITADWKQVIPAIIEELYKNNLLTDKQYTDCVTMLAVFEQYDLYGMESPTVHGINLVEGFKSKHNMDFTTSKSEELEITIIPGAEPDHYNICSSLNSFFKALQPLFKKVSLKNSDTKTVIILEDLKAREFYFDAEEGRYVTHEITKDMFENQYKKN